MDALPGLLRAHCGGGNALALPYYFKRRIQNFIHGKILAGFQRLMNDVLLLGIQLNCHSGPSS